MGYSNREVCHLWASGNKESASSNHGNVYFQRGKLYSYGSHFMLGYIAAPRVVFLNSDGYSISTAKHKAYASAAVSHFRRFYLAKLQDYADFLDLIRGHISNPRKGADLKALRQRTERKFGDFLANNPGAAEHDGWQWIFEQIGTPGRMAVIARKVARVKASKAVADEREAVATWRANGKLYAEMSSSEFASAVNATRYQENEYRGVADLEALANKLHLAHKQANRDKFNRRKAILWQRLGRVRSAIKAMKESGTCSYVQRGRLPVAVRAIAGIRELERAIAKLCASGAESFIGPRALDTAALHVGRLLSGHMPPATRERLTDYARRLNLASAMRSEQIERERYEAEAAEREAWISGESVYTRARLSDERGGALIRCRDAEVSACTVVSGELETSHGARVPLRHAARVFAFVRRLREAGEGWEANPERPVRVGHYSLDRVYSSGDFVAGCHRINWGETERLARELGLWDCPGDMLASAAETETAN
jgi:hypothetical protein